MLKYLRIQNLILIENAEIHFESGLNILTGETGAGKSAIMNGLNLAFGERSDANMIRRGADKGVVEAIFEMPKNSELSSLLIDSGIDFDHQDELIIRRELSDSGKNRILINNQAAQLTLLRKIGNFLAQVVGQHSNHRLFQLEYHREVLDLFGELNGLLSNFRTHFEKESAARKELDLLVGAESERLRSIDICRQELEELEEAQLKEREDEELFSEYTLLINSKELIEKVKEINHNLSGERQSILTLLNRHKILLDSLVEVDPVLLDTARSLQSAFLELQEISTTLRRYQGSFSDDPKRLTYVSERLALINRLKRKYGSTIEEINSYRKETAKKLSHLENADVQIENLQKELATLKENSNKAAAELSRKRKCAAKNLEEKLTLELHALNMSKSRFLIEITEQKRNAHGDDKVEFFLQPNVGEHKIALKEAASGGEVSRVLLAIQKLLAGKDHVPSLVFDEVDANIGGETAAIIGDKLREISARHQIICITHFPQVACRADHHFQISKQEKEGRTVSSIKKLDAGSQKRELERMAGGKAR